MGEDLPFLPYGRHDIGDDDVESVVAVLKGDWLTTGPTVAAFEGQFADRVGAAHAVSCSSGTAGLHLAVRALGLGPGDAAIVPSMTFLATANCVRYEGADVIFADVDPATGLITPETFVDALKRAEGRSVRAVLPVHLNGQMAEMEGLGREAAARGIRVIEDACHALGAEYVTGDGSPSRAGDCRFGDMAVFSLHPVKTITMGEGGVVSTNDPDLARRMACFRSHGMIRDPEDFVDPSLAFSRGGAANPWYYEMHEVGFNYRASDLNCALGMSQLQKLDRFVARRNHLVARYRSLIAERLAPTTVPVSAVSWSHGACHLFVVLVDFEAVGRDRATVIDTLRHRGIGSMVHYLPVHLQPYYRKLYGTIDLPGAWRYYQRSLSLPLFPAMADSDVDRVVEALAYALSE